MTTVAAPVSPNERVQGLDLLRGAAVLGMIFVNMWYYAGPIYAVHTGMEPGIRILDRLATWFILFFCAGKFYPIFSSLFGLGIALQVERGESAGGRYVLRLNKRMMILLVIGIAHGLLLWYGDILSVYACLGFLLLFFRKCSNRTLLWSAALFFLVTLFVQVYLIARTRPEDYQARTREYTIRANESFDSYAFGNIQQILDQRLQDLEFIFTHQYFVIAPETLAFFLIGLYWGREKFPKTSRQVEMMRKSFTWVLGISFVAALLFAIAYASALRVPSFLTFFGAMMLYHLSTLALSFFYIEAILLLQYRQKWKKLLESVARVGRTALSNYLLQSLICTTLFYSYGLGLYGKLTPGYELLLSIGIYIVQIGVSMLWLRKFAWGPLEWLWRSLTYGKGYSILANDWKVTR